MLIRFFAPLALLGCIFLTGCSLASVKMESVPLSYDVPGGPLVLTEVEEAKKPLLRVTPFEDKRPARQTKGAKPSAWYLGVVNWRIGQYVTGDGIWDGLGGRSVSDAVTESTRDCFTKSYFFEKVEIEKDAAATGGSGYILKGEIEQLYAEQSVKSYAYFIGYMETSQQISTPKGYCKLNYTLIDADTGSVVHQGSAVEESKDTKGRVGEIAQGALRKAQTKMANDIMQVLLAL